MTMYRFQHQSSQGFLISAISLLSMQEKVFWGLNFSFSKYIWHWHKIVKIKLLIQFRHEWFQTFLSRLTRKNDFFIFFFSRKNRDVTFESVIIAETFLRFN